MSRLSAIGKRALPAVVSIAVLAWLVGTVERDALMAALTWRVAAVMIPALLAYGAATLLLESLAIMRIIENPPEGFGLWTAARIKCASYLLGIVNYALGAGALAVLLRRRAGLGLGEAASLVLMISSTDLVVVLAMAGVGAALVETGAPTIQAGVLAGAMVAFFGGLALLRVPGSFGPLERIRSLAIFDALRRMPLRSLAVLLFIRTFFAASFVGICAASFVAFDVSAPLAEVVVGVLIVGVVAGVPIAVAGLGTSQAAFLFIFRAYAPEATLLAQSIVLSAGMLVLRALMGTVFAREFTQEALRETRGAES
jgi:uncharacterized membrane protein YbhN (UPF0104 family)